MARARSPEVGPPWFVPNVLSEPGPSPSTMAGELREGRVVVDDSGEGSALYNRGFFGRPQPGGGVELNLLEAVYLVEAGRLEIRRRGKPVSVRGLFRAADAAVDAFEIRYPGYPSRRRRGYHGQ